MSSGEESLGSASRRKVLAVTSFMSKEAQAMRKKDDMTIPLTGEANGTGKGKVLKTDYRSIGSPNSSDEDDETGNHCHRKEKNAEVDNKARNKLIIASVLCLIFMCGEAVGKIPSRGYSTGRSNTSCHRQHTCERCA